MSLICWSLSAPSYRMLHEGMPARSGPARSPGRCRPSSDRGVPGVGAAADGREVRRVREPSRNRMMPPFSSGPWHRTQPTPSWFSSVNGWTARAPALEGELLRAPAPGSGSGPGSKSHWPGTRRRRTRASRRPSPEAAAAPASRARRPRVPAAAHRGCRDPSAAGPAAAATSAAIDGEDSSPPRTRRTIAVVLVCGQHPVVPAPHPGATQKGLAAAGRSCRSLAGDRGRPRTCRP